MFATNPARMSKCVASHALAHGHVPSRPGSIAVSPAVADSSGSWVADHGAAAVGLLGAVKSR